MVKFKSVFVDLLHFRCPNHGDKLQGSTLLVDENDKPQYFNRRCELDRTIYGSIVPCMHSKFMHAIFIPGKLYLDVDYKCM